MCEGILTDLGICGYINLFVIYEQIWAKIPSVSSINLLR